MEDKQNCSRSQRFNWIKQTQLEGVEWFRKLMRLLHYKGLNLDMTFSLNLTFFALLFQVEELEACARWWTFTWCRKTSLCVGGCCNTIVCVFAEFMGWTRYYTGVIQGESFACLPLLCIYCPRLAAPMYCTYHLGIHQNKTHTTSEVEEIKLWACARK